MKGLIDQLLEIWNNPDRWSDRNFQRSKKLFARALKFQIQSFMKVLKKSRMNHTRLTRCLEILTAIQRAKEVLLDDETNR